MTRSSQLLQAPAAHPFQRSWRRGFSLVELFVVVIIIAVIALLAMPAITKQMRDRRTREVAERLATLYRNARMRAMGRGSAVLIQFDYKNDRVQVREAVRGGPAGGCALLPTSSCTLPTDWTADATAVNGTQQVELLDLKQRAEFKDIGITPEAGGSANVLEVCFTPMGRALQRTDVSPAFLTMSGVPAIAVARTQGTTTIGLTRFVTLLPNGMARLGTARGP